MTESMTSPHSKHCHPGIDSPLIASLISMRLLNPPQREHIMQIIRGSLRRHKKHECRQTRRSHRLGQTQTNCASEEPDRERRRLRNQTRRRDRDARGIGQSARLKTTHRFTLQGAICGVNAHRERSFRKAMILCGYIFFHARTVKNPKDCLWPIAANQGNAVHVG